MNNPLLIVAGAIVLWLYVAGPAKVATDLGTAYHNFVTAAQDEK